MFLNKITKKHTFSFINNELKNIKVKHDILNYDKINHKTVTNLDHQPDCLINPENSSQQQQLTFVVAYILFSLYTIFWTCFSQHMLQLFVCLSVCLLLFVCYHVLFFLCFKYINNCILRQYLLKSLYRGLLRDIIK